MRPKVSVWDSAVTPRSTWQEKKVLCQIQSSSDRFPLHFSPFVFNCVKRIHQIEVFAGKLLQANRPPRHLWTSTSRRTDRRTENQDISVTFTGRYFTQQKTSAIFKRLLSFDASRVRTCWLRRSRANRSSLRQRPFHGRPCLC